MEQRTEEVLSPYRTFSRAEWAAKRADTPMTLDAGGGDAPALAARPARHEGGRGHLPAAVAAAVALRRRRPSACSARSRASSAPKTPRCPTSSASRARWRSASPPPRACCRRCWRAGRTCRRSISSPPTAFSIPNAILEREGLMERRAFRRATTCRRCCASSPTSRPAAGRRARRSIRISSTT